MSAPQGSAGRSARSQVVTFYSFKGGTGRSMMLANVAWILASNGHKVLTIDWDLEAPGLHRYFGPFLADRELRRSDGVIDFAIEFCVAAAMAPPTLSLAEQPVGHEPAHTSVGTDPPEAVADGGSRKRWLRPVPDEVTEPTEPTIPEWFDDYADITRFALPLQWTFPDEGCIDFVGAGRQSASYSTRVNGFSWRDFYERFDGGVLLKRAIELMKKTYDYVLIDSRTGVSDTSGICTVQLPDTLVVCFTLNGQSVDGASAVAESARGQREDLVVLPVPMRIENSEKEKLEIRRDYALRRFEGLLPGASSGEQEDYWRAVEVPYVPYYAYEEVLATFRDRPGSSLTVLNAAEQLTSTIAGRPHRALRMPEPARQRTLSVYEGRVEPIASRAASADTAVYISYRRVDSAYAIRLFDRLASTLGTDRVVMDVQVLPGDDVAETITRAVKAASTVVVLIGPLWMAKGPGEWVTQEVRAAIESGVRVIPVLVGNAVLPSSTELADVGLPELGRRQAAAVADDTWNQDVDRLVAAVELARVSELASTPAATPRYSPATTSEASASVIDEVLRSNRATNTRGQVRAFAIGLAVALVVAVVVYYFARY